MTEDLPSKYGGFIVIMIIVTALAIFLIFGLHKSGSVKTIFRDFLYWIPGMSIVINLFGGF